MAKKKVKKTTARSTGGSPQDVAGDVELNSPLVSERPNTPEDKKDDNPDGEPKKRTRRTKKKIEEEAQQQTFESNKIIAGTFVDMQTGIMEKLCGEIWKAEPGEREALVNAWTRFLCQFDMLPWWAELAVAQGSYMLPRLLIMYMQAQQREREKRAAMQKDVPFDSAGPVVNESGQLNPV